AKLARSFTRSVTRRASSATSSPIRGHTPAICDTPARPRHRKRQRRKARSHELKSRARESDFPEFIPEHPIVPEGKPMSQSADYPEPVCETSNSLPGWIASGTLGLAIGAAAAVLGMQGYGYRLPQPGSGEPAAQDANAGGMPRMPPGGAAPPPPMMGMGGMGGMGMGGMGGGFGGGGEGDRTAPV